MILDPLFWHSGPHHTHFYAIRLLYFLKPHLCETNWGERNSLWMYLWLQGRHSSFCLPLLSKITPVLSSSTWERNLTLREGGIKARRKTESATFVPSAHRSRMVAQKSHLEERNKNSFKDFVRLWKGPQTVSLRLSFIFGDTGRNRVTKRKKCVIGFRLFGFVFAQTHCFSLLRRRHSSDL